MRSALFLLCATCGVVAGAEPASITEIEIRTGNVFTPAEAASAFFPYRLANALHVESRTSLIEKYFLFGVGDPLDAERLAETERNLRATGLFWFVQIRAEGTKVIVETQDAWTLLLRGGLSNKGGVVTYQIGVEEGNLLGTGRQADFLYDKDTQRISRSFTFGDPAFLGPYTSLRVLYSDLSDGTVYEGRLFRPFFALEAPWSGGAFYRQARFKQKLYAGGEEATIWSEMQRIFRVEGGLRVSVRGDRALRLLGFVERENVALSPGELGPPPPADDSDRRFLFIGGGLESEGRAWISRRDVEKIDRVEDFNLAPSGRFELGFSPAVDGAMRAVRLVARGSLGTTIPDGFAVATLAGETRYQDGPRNARLSFDVRGYVQTLRFTYVARLGLLAGFRPDPEVQIPLDGENGVRGYRLHAVEGKGRAVGNLELRTVFFYDVLKLVSFGAAAFVDAGVSWGAPDGFWHLADAGLGLRFGLTRAAQTSLLRLDLARSFRPDPLGRTGWLLSFSSSQAF